MISDSNVMHDLIKQTECTDENVLLLVVSVLFHTDIHFYLTVLPPVPSSLA